MAAVTQGRNTYGTMGSRHTVSTTFTSPADTNTWDTGLKTVEFAGFTIVEASGSASDAIAVGSISGATVTLDVQGTVDSALAWAIGW